MPWLRMGPEEPQIEVEIPAARIGLLQSEAETSRSPAYDVYRFLETRTFVEPEVPRWKVEPFNERTYGGVLRAPVAIDALIIGYNAIHLSLGGRRQFNRLRPRAAWTSARRSAGRGRCRRRAGRRSRSLWRRACSPRRCRQPG